MSNPEDRRVRKQILASPTIAAGDSIIIKNKVPTTGVNENVNTCGSVPLEQCDLCSAQYELPGRVFAQPDLNRLIYKLLQIEPHNREDGSTYFSQYIAVCSTCAIRLRRYDKQRVELDILKQEIVSSILDTIVHIRPNDDSPLHDFKDNIIANWSGPGAASQKSCPTWVSNVPGVRSQQFGRNPPSIPISPGKKVSRVGRKTPSQETQTKSPLKNTSATSIAVQSIEYSGIEDKGSGQQDVVGTTWLASTGVESEYPQEVEVSIYTEGECGSELITNCVAEHFVLDHEYAQSGGGTPPRDDGDNDSQDETTTNVLVHQSQPLKRKQPTVSNIQMIYKHESQEEAEGQPLKKKRKPNNTTKCLKKSPFMCEGCGRIFSKVQTLRTHSQRGLCRGEEETIPKVCTLCSQDFSTSSWTALKAHIEAEHENVVLTKCRFCRKEYFPNSFEDHSCCHPTEVVSRKEYKCDHCESRIYYTSNALSHHIIKKHKEATRDFKCKICEKTFLANSILQSHMGTHKLKPTPFACNECGVCTTTAWSLREHQRLHTGEKPFACAVCGKTFRLRNTLTNHMVVHTKEKNFVCEICGTKFSLYCTMLRHWKLHNNPTPEMGEHCPICVDGPLFKKSGTLKKHMLAKHPGQLDICARPMDAVESAELEKKEEKRMEKIKLAMSQVKKEAMSKSKGSGEDESDGEDPEFEVETDIKNVEFDPSTGRSTTMSTRYGGKRIVRAKKEIEVVLGS